MVKVWLPYVRSGSGSDVYTQLLAAGLASQGASVSTMPFRHYWQYAPWRMRLASPLPDTDVILANSWNAFAFSRKRCLLIVVAHHCVFDKAYLPYRSRAQAIFHESLVRRFERRSFEIADSVVAVSQYTANSIRECFGVSVDRMIHNGIDTDFFTPAGEKKEPLNNRKMRLLFVGNPTKRKGGDLLFGIMQRLGREYELRYTSGLREAGMATPVENIVCLGRLSGERLREEYRRADALLFPSRLEGFGYAVAEAMACGTPVIASRVASLPELVVPPKTGILCPVNDVEAFADAARLLATDTELRLSMGREARARAVRLFSFKVMAPKYLELIRDLTHSRVPCPVD